MEIDKVLAEEALRENKYIEQYDDALKKIIEVIGVEKRKISKSDYEIKKRFLNGEIDFEEFELMVKEEGEKNICREYFNSDWNNFYSYRNELKAIAEDDNDVEKNGRFRPLSEEDGKAHQDPKSGTYIPTHSTHFDKNLGDLAGFVAIGNRGYVAELFKQGYIREITPDGAKHLVFDATHQIISDLEAMSVAQQLNKERIIIEANMIQNVHGDSKTTKQAISIITNAGKKRNWNYAKTNEVGTEVRKECQKYDNEFGKLLAYSITEEIPEEKKNQKVSRFIFNMMKALNVNVNDCVASVTTMNKKRSDNNW